MKSSRAVSLFRIMVCMNLICLVSSILCNERGRVVTTPGHNDIRIGHRRSNVVLERWLDVLVVLSDNRVEAPAALGYVSLESSGQPDVRIGVNKYFNVHQIYELLAGKGHDSLKNDHIGTIHCFGSRFPRVSGEVVHWYVDLFASFQLVQGLDDEVKVEGVRVVEIVLVSICQLVLFFGQHFVERVHAEERDPLDRSRTRAACPPCRWSWIRVCAHWCPFPTCSSFWLG
ncbi:hypothetical protein BpHYR1_041052 [Brachionus plicatilis]|uniref:Uncharacterized protein n=1 Tax=Brachionus plicatilis TaxID=10195 RepID=A0A3M7QPN4_BRAPC|nr:hypothetical protein BpHYR1_041052 [Brachionus plicatilis]